MTVRAILRQTSLSDAESAGTPGRKSILLYILLQMILPRTEAAAPNEEQALRHLVPRLFCSAGFWIV